MRNQFKLIYNFERLAGINVGNMHQRLKWSIRVQSLQRCNDCSNGFAEKLKNAVVFNLFTTLRSLEVNLTPPEMVEFRSFWVNKDSSQGGKNWFTDVVDALLEDGFRFYDALGSYFVKF